MKPRLRQPFAALPSLDGTIAESDISVMKTVVIVGAALGQWTKLAPDVRKRLRAKLDIYAATGAGDVKALRGHDGARPRVGD